MDVFIADDSRVVRERLVSMLADLDGVRVVGEAGNIKGAVQGIVALRPDTVILDIEMPGGSGLDVLKSIANLSPRPRVIMLTNSPHSAYREECRRAGADFFFDKTLEFERVSQILKMLRSTVASDRAPQMASGETTEEETRPGRRGAGFHAAPHSTPSVIADATLLARQLCGAAVAYVHTADYEPGIPASASQLASAGESRLYVALCVQTLRDGDILLINDIASDFRFSGKQLVCAGGPMRFFAGVPLISAGGRRFGTLAILDPEPRSLSPAQEDALRVLGRQTTACLESASGHSGNSSAERSASGRLRTRDQLTGLRNREALTEILLHGIAHATRYAEKLGFLYLNLDNFHRVNQSCGRPVGDAFLVETGKRLTASVRGSDTVARLGGDEFGVLVGGLHGIEDAVRVAQKLLRIVNLPLSAGGRRWAPSCSIGISLFPQDGADGEALLRHADAAMYRAKSVGKGGFELFAASAGHY
ncbi:MAG: diguanylate cyclase domain-containing protein [Chromatiales bacterium]